jgi:branched-chain amino acid transport system substrate-binding protein
MTYARSLLVAVLTLAAFAPFLNGGALAQTAPPYEISAILSLTGPIAFGGKEQQKTLGVIEGVVNKTGGIQGHPLKFTYLDDQSNPQVAVQLTNELIAKHVPFIWGPIFTATCAAAAPIVEKSGPTMYCMTPGYQPGKGSYAFSPGGSSSDQDEALLNYFVQQHWNRVAILTTNDATGQAAVQGFQAHLAEPRFKALSLVALESMGYADITVSAQLGRIKAARPDVIAFTGSGAPYGTMLRGLTDAGMETVPICSSSANMTFGQMDQYKDILPKTALFTASRGLAMSATPRGPVLDAQRLFNRSFDAAGVKANGVNENVWDPTWILIGAVRKLGVNATSAQVKDYIENLHGWAGVRGVYDFARGDQRGIGADAVVVYRWDGAKTDFVPISGPAGAPLKK